MHVIDPTTQKGEDWGADVNYPRDLSAWAEVLAGPYEDGHHQTWRHAF